MADEETGPAISRNRDNKKTASRKNARSRALVINFLGSIRGEADRTGSVIVEAIGHHKRGCVLSRGKSPGDLQLILQILADFLAIDPEFHALGNPVESIACGPEGESASDGLAARARADMDAEFVGRGRSAVCRGVGIEQNESSSAGAVARITIVPCDAKVVARVEVEIANERGELGLAGSSNVDRSLKRSVSFAQNISGGRVGNCRPCSDDCDIVEEIAIQISRNDGDIISVLGDKFRVPSRSAPFEYRTVVT